MRKLLVVIFVLFLYSCKVSLTPLKGKYPVEYSFTSNKTSDKLIERVKEYCSKNSLKITVANEGTLIAEDYRFSFFTFENPDGTPKITNAHIVIGCEKKEGQYKCLEPEMIQGDIAFKVSEQNSQRTVSISLINLKSSWGFNSTVGKSYSFRDVKSTGVFEREIADMIK